MSLLKGRSAGRLSARRRLGIPVTSGFTPISTATACITAWAGCARPSLPTCAACTGGRGRPWCRLPRWRPTWPAKGLSGVRVVGRGSMPNCSTGAP